MIYHVTTNKTIEKAILDLKATLKERSFGVLWEMNFKDKLAEKGLEFDKNFVVLEVCNPVQAKRVLDEHIEVGYFLPCKIVVYEKGNETLIGLSNPTSLIGMLELDYLTDVALEVENILKAAINAAR
ncbi:MAG: DUF302 domain-containing protein [Vallitaleaceae bacterium]|jgi:uncharacterized protein (DUF302 family)|nr:DUF302 domain-containing protein [Vallitaleaceae bacterium]